jgi:glycosyltransferase involved in cell wall biosynthesis
MRILWQLQLSNYYNGKFSLSGDSNWTTFIAKAKQLLKRDPNIKFDIIMPSIVHCTEDYYSQLRDEGLAFSTSVWAIDIIPNALATRYDFNYDQMFNHFSGVAPGITHVYINDPSLLGNYMAMFLNYKWPRPKFIVQCHFLDSPNTRIVPADASYWWRTVEACEKADLMVWHCASQEEFFFGELANVLRDDYIDANFSHSTVWKSGHSTELLDTPVNPLKIRFDTKLLDHNSKVVWVPNRIGGLGISLDYTNNGRFMFEEVQKVQGDFVVYAGNPSQKISNSLLAQHCAKYVELLSVALTTDEYKLLTQRADIVVALYTEDTNGGIAVLEAIHYGAVPLMPDIYEYKQYFDAVDWPHEFRVAPDLSNVAEVLQLLLDNLDTLRPYVKRLQGVIKRMYSFESTTERFYQKLTSLTKGFDRRLD